MAENEKKKGINARRTYITRAGTPMRDAMNLAGSAWRLE